MAPESNILDWLTWPADLLLRAGGFVASWFFSEDATSFTVVQMMFATLVLAAARSRPATRVRIVWTGQRRICDSSSF
jgi:hypothetical protein